SERGLPTAARSDHTSGGKLHAPGRWSGVCVRRVRAANGNGPDDATPGKSAVPVRPERRNCRRSKGATRWSLHSGAAPRLLFAPHFSKFPMQKNDWEDYQFACLAALSDVKEQST